MPRLQCRLLLVLILAAPSAASATDVTENVPLPGGTKALAHVLGIEPAPEPARAVSEFARLLHGVPHGANARVDERSARLLEHGSVVARFQNALAALQPATGGLSLKMATASKNDRKRLQGLLELVGLRLREQKKQFRVERDRNRAATERATSVADVGVDLDDVVARLNAGATVRIEVPADTVPIPIGAVYWASTFFRQKLEPRDIVTAILLDRRASLICRGLLALDDATLMYLAAHPQMIEDFDGARAPAFGAFGQALVIHEGHVIPPGGADALPLWEDLLGETVSKPERFVRELFGRDGGRVAYLYAVLAALDPDRRAFALGTWITDARLRRQRFRALVDASNASTEGWDIEKRPFLPPPYDSGLTLSSVAVQAGGAPREPAARKFWARVFDNADFPDQPARELRNLEEDGVVDAAWLVEQVAAGDVAVRPVRLEQLRFGQRVFGNIPAADLGGALIAVRALVRVPILMRTIERAGARAPSAFAAAARRAAQITDLGTSEAYTALTGFQGSVALVERLARGGALTSAQVEQLLTSLALIAPDRDAQLGPGLAEWLQHDVGAALGQQERLTEQIIIEGAAGLGRFATPTIRWEQRSYRVDVAAADARHIAQARQRQQGLSIDAALSVDRVRRTLAASQVSLADVKQAVAALSALAPQLLPVKLAPQERPPDVDVGDDLQQQVLRVARDLAKITRNQDVKKAADQLPRLARVVERAVSQSLLLLTYAWSAADAEAQGDDGGVVALRHHFGFGENGEESRMLMWFEPKADIAPGHPWRVRGAILGLDVAFGPQMLRRLSTDGAEAPTLGGNDIATLTRGLSLVAPHRMSDEAQRAIAAALARGRARVAALPKDPEALDAVAADAAMDGWRARAVRWSLSERMGQVGSYFSLKELLLLGKLDDGVDLSPWGMSSQAFGGCLCTEVDRHSTWWTASGRTQFGALPSEVPDLNLRVAEVLDELRLPAVLGRAVLAWVVQAYIDRVHPSDDDDWFGLVRQAASFPREQIEDAIAALVADGPLLPEPASAPGAR